MAPRLETTVVGAGPAGLLFCAVSRLLQARRGVERDLWTIRLLDKRDSYVRTHRLRIDPAPYVAIQRELEEPAFDRLVAFLAEHGFSPEVNALEDRLLALAGELGIRREVLAVGDQPGETPLAALRPAGGVPWTIVAADSVHSFVREAVRGDVAPERFTHQRVARLRVEGTGLSPSLGAVEQYRLSKVLGSILDYRLNRNGFAEVDLFLAGSEHDALGELGATPREPVAISSRDLARTRAPLFRRIVEQLERGPGGSSRRVLLHSTFRLEHTVMPRVSFEPAGLGARVFLVGDAAVSLPFFRGMACLARCARALAHLHVGLVEGQPDVAGAKALASYDAAVARIVRDELGVVRARARLVRGLREFIRVSALLPFPLQSWWLSKAETERAPDELTFGFWLNAALAATAAGLVLADRALPGCAWASLPVELAGGFAYHAALNLERGPHRLVRRVWQVQILAVFLSGAAVSALAAREGGVLAVGLAPLWWFILALPFVAGLYLLEALGGRWEARAALEDRPGASG